MWWEFSYSTTFLLKMYQEEPPRFPVSLLQFFLNHTWKKKTAERPVIRPFTVFSSLNGTNCIKWLWKLKLHSRHVVYAYRVYVIRMFSFYVKETAISIINFTLKSTYFLSCVLKAKWLLRFMHCSQWCDTVINLWTRDNYHSYIRDSSFLQLLSCNI